MRHPDATRLRARCAELLDGLVTASAESASPLPDLRGEAIFEHTQGWVNVCYELGDVAIVRINARDPHLPKFAREAAVFCDERVHEHVPVPRVLLHRPARSPRARDYPVLVTSKLPGENLEQHWHALDASRRHALARHAGKLLRALHQITSPSGFGDPHDPHHTTWSSRLLTEAARHAVEMRACGAASDEAIDRALELFARSTVCFDEVTIPRLTHRDYHFGNLLFLEDRITGVLDFEWCEYGDVRRDLLKWAQIAHLYPGSQEGFVEGYGEQAWQALTQPSPRDELYALLGAMEMSVVATQFFPESEARGYRQRFETCLAQMGRGCLR